jgi:hypothetical protein
METSNEDNVPLSQYSSKARRRLKSMVTTERSNSNGKDKLPQQEESGAAQAEAGTTEMTNNGKNIGWFDKKLL